MMLNKKGFTLVELMVSLAIVGVLLMTAVPVYHTWQQRAYGSEAAIMLKQLINAEIVYYLDNDHYYPEDGNISIYNDGGMEPDGALGDVKKNLKIDIPRGHFINYQIYGGKTAYIEISSAGNFNLFKNASVISATLDGNGHFIISKN